VSKAIGKRLYVESGTVKATIHGNVSIECSTIARPARSPYSARAHPS